MIAFQDYTLVISLGQTGLTEVTLQLKAPSSIEFEEITLVGEAFQEAGYGYYNITIPKAFIQEIGTYIFRAVVDGTPTVAERECLPKPLSSSVSPELCLVIGNLRDISGRSNAFDNSEIVIRPLKLPTSYAGTTVVGQSVVARTDFDGFFSVPVIRGSKVIIEVKDAGVRFQTTIPDIDSIRIEDLMP